MADETGWVVVDDRPGDLNYWTGFRWSFNNLDALRLSRRADAETLARAQLPGRAVRIEDHMWMDCLCRRKACAYDPDAGCGAGA